MLKVLGKEFEEEPFFKRVFLNITCKTSIRVPPLLLRCIFLYHLIFILTFLLKSDIINYKYTFLIAVPAAYCKNLLYVGDDILD